MSKKPILIATMILAAGALCGAMRSQEETPMKLVNIKTGFVIVEFKDGQPSFHDRFLEAEMKETGILIPPDRMDEFEGKETIYLGDPLFERAFTDVYVPLCIASSVYQWKK